MRLSYLLIAYASLFCFGLIDNGRGSVLPDIIEQLNISTIKGSQFFAISSFSSLFINILGRWWLPHWGPLKSQKIFLFLLFISTLGFGLAGYLQNSYLLLIVFSLMFGLSLSGINISANAWITSGSAPNLKKRALAGLHAMYGLSSILAPFLFGIFLKIGLNWRIFYVILSTLPFLVFASTSFLKPTPYEKKINIQKISLPLKIRLKIESMFSLYVIGEISISAWLVLYLNRTQGFTSETSTLFLALFFVMFFIGRLSFALFTFPGSNYRWLLISSISSLAVYLLGLFVHPIALSLCGLTMSFYFPVALSWVSDKYNEHMDTFIPSIMATICGTLILMHWTIGWLANTVGIQWALLIGPIAIIGSIIMLASTASSSKTETA